MSWNDGGAPRLPEPIDPRLRSAQLFSDVERLRGQVDSSWEKEERLLRRLGLADGTNIVDVGCGPGFAAERLLRAFPSCHITAVDLDPVMTELAESRLKFAGDRVVVLTGSASSLDMDDAEADFGLVRFLLQHVASPEWALREAHRVLKPGGRLAIVDVDDSMGGLVDPPIDGFDRISALLPAIQAGRGGDRYVGRKLPGLLTAEGFEDVTFEVIALHSAELGLQAFHPQLDPERFLPFIGEGGLTAEQWEHYRAGFARFMADPRAVVIQLLVIASGRKPPT